MRDLDGVSCTILRHLTVNTLAELPDGHLYSRLFDYEDNDQAENWIQLIDELYRIMEIIVEAPNPRSLGVSWLDRDKQQVLREVFSAGIISREYISRYVKLTWDQIIGERHFGEKMEYEVPSILIYVGMQLSDPDMSRPGHFHLGVLYPFDELALRHHIFSYATSEPRRSGRNARWLPQKQRHLLTGLPPLRQLKNFTRIYPQPRSPDPDKDDSWKVFPEVLIRNFGGIISQLATNLVDRIYPQLRIMPYRQVINAWGGPNKIAEHLCGYIDCDVLSVQGEKLSVELLDKVAVKQSERGKLWLPYSGYADYVTDDSDPRYIRIYIGQTKVSDRRLMQHINDATRSLPETLHIFIIHQGNGRRAMNFLKLWTIHDLDSMDEESAIILPNILEMTMCVAFQSLPQQVLETFFGPPASPDHHYAGVGLNVLCPLYQGMNSAIKVRQETIAYLESSPDPQIVKYPTFRAKSRRPNVTVQGWKGDKNMETWKEYIQLFRSAVGIVGNGEDLFDAPATPTTELLTSSHQAAKKKLSTAIADITGENIHEGFPVEDSVPWGIRETGFTDKNCLMWFSDPRCRKFTQKSQALGPKVSEKLIQYHRQIIENSRLRIIILDLEASQHVIPSISVNLRGEFQLQFYCGTISGFVEKDDQGRLKRAYLQSPRSLSSLWSCPGPATQIISEMFKLSAAMTRTQGIRPYYCASSSAVHQILRIYGEEQDGAPRITVTDIPVMIQAFLYRKGFRRPEDIQRLVDIGGYLSRGLLLLLVVLRRQPPQFGDSRALRTAGSKRKAHRRGIFSSDEMLKVDSLLPAALELPSISEGTGLSEKSLAYIALANEKEEDLRATSKEVEDEHLDLEINDVGVDTLCSELFPEADEDNDDMGPAHSHATLQLSKLPHSTAQRRSPEWYLNRQVDKRILDGGIKYRGYWRPERGELLLHVLPDLAHIQITLRGKVPQNDSRPEILVKAEIHPAKRHPACWALDARDTDPGAKLALIVDDEEGKRYVNSKGEGIARKANTFVDWFSGCSLETIASRPRRHIDTGKGDTVLRALKLSVRGTYYTDDHGQLIRIQHGASVPVIQASSSDI
ncbi:hypothetical protein BJX63DRAFT_437470 [Aspergillus granulosus]|uniref:GIY-YIG domain-containing protein n=1 Tax=Aspergillus granulosus TaxID=176169 RepID=A0ABR4GUY1_9EURO